MIVKDYVRVARIGSQDMYVPLSHAPGEAQEDFGEAVVVIGATGAFGSAAVLLSCALGAERVVAAGRNAAVLQELTQIDRINLKKIGDIRR